MWICERKVYNLKVMFRILSSQVTAQKKCWIFCGIVELIAVFLNLTAIYKNYSIGYNVIPCKADFFVWENGLYAKLFYIVPVMLILFMKSNKAVAGEQFLIRKYKRRAVWDEMVFRILVISLMLTIFHMACVFLYTILNSADNMNWNQERSVFWILTDGKVCEQNSISYMQVIICFFVFESITSFITGIIYLLCDVWFGKSILAWFICLGMILVEQVIGIPTFLYGKISLDYSNWLKQDFIRMAITGGTLGVTGVIFGRYLIGRKEYYGK